MIRSLILCAFLSAFTLVLQCSGAQADSSVVSTMSGSVAGVNGPYQTTAFLGIPYAAPPVGNLRWKAPRPPARWNGTLRASHFQNSCPQKGSFFANVPSSQFGQPIGNEDCLYMNVWRPQNSDGQNLPVVFWIHGGSNYKGTSSDPMYDGAYMASHDNVVFVSLNYRLGMLGAIANDDLLSGSQYDRSGNFVTLDLIQGLNWVHKNIANFGGNPRNITIMGHSAGCMNVWGLIQSPLARNHFQKAVCSAGIPNSFPKFMAEVRTNDFLKNLVINAGFAQDHDGASSFLSTKGPRWVHDFMYSRTTEQVVQAENFIIPFQHIEDGLVFPHGLEGVLLGQFNQVPMIIGGTKDEGTYLAGMSFFKPDDKQLWSYIQNPPPSLQVSDLIKVNFTVFRATTDAATIALWNVMNSVYWTVKLHGNPAYHYIFAWDKAPQPWNDVFGSIHGMDMLFYLGNFVTDKPNFGRFAWSNENKDSREELRARMNRYFSGFFWNGNPNSNLQKGDQSWDDQIVFK